MLRRLVAMAMLVSFMAMATSGAMMFVIERPSFTIQMHPVHKLFGLLMVIAAVAHIILNLNSLKTHLRTRAAQLALAILSALLVLLYGVAVNNRLPADLATQMDEAAAKAERRDRSAR